MKIGIECEGIYSGTKTLLITRKEFESMSINNICAIATSNDCTNLYLGADQTITKYDSMFSIESLLDLRNLWPHLITVEMPIEFLQNYSFRKNSALKNVRFIVTVKAQIEDLHPLDMIKVESDDNCYLAPLYSFYKNEKNYLDTILTVDDINLTRGNPTLGKLKKSPKVASFNDPNTGESIEEYSSID